MQPEVIAGRYRVVREIGRGGMGTVWLCHDERLDREVAVKQVGGFPGETRPQITRALREARSSAALQHPSVVSIFDAVEEDEHIWLVMEYVPSRTLSQLYADGPLSPRRVARIGAQVAAGLAAAHARGTVHRDVKPGNVLVADDDVAKISDFGIARSLGDEQLTQTGLVTGTPAYFAPELARGEDPTAASDVWALGATLYAAVEGRLPYPEKTNAIALLTSIATEAPRRPVRAGPLTEPIGRMMEPDPAQRWSMAEAADALRRLGGVAAADPEPDEQETRQDTLAVAPVPAPDPDPTPTPEPEPVPAPAPAPTPADDPDRARGRGAVVLLAALALLAALVGGGWALTRGDSDGSATSASGDSSSEATEDSEDPEGSEGSEGSAPGSGDDTPSEDPEESTSDDPDEESEDAEPAGDPGAVVGDYYALLPDDTEAAWDRLSPDLQDEVGSYDRYAGFWGTIDDVRVDSTSPAGDGQVDVTLTYTTDGSKEQEVRRIRVEEVDGEELLTGDQVVG